MKKIGEDELEVWMKLFEEAAADPDFKIFTSYSPVDLPDKLVGNDEELIELMEVIATEPEEVQILRNAEKNGIKNPKLYKLVCNTDYQVIKRNKKIGE